MNALRPGTIVTYNFGPLGAKYIAMITGPWRDEYRAISLVNYGGRTVGHRLTLHPETLKVLYRP